MHRTHRVLHRDALLAAAAHIAVGATERGVHYLEQDPGAGGWLLFSVCPLAVFMAGARILDSIERERAEG